MIVSELASQLTGKKVHYDQTNDLIQLSFDSVVISEVRLMDNFHLYLARKKKNGFITFTRYNTDIFLVLGKIHRHRCYGVKNVLVQKSCNKAVRKIF